MATTNNKCKKCGCEDSFMTSPAPCPTPIGCPTPEPCSEVFDAQCVVYTGDPIVCGEDTVVSENDTVAEALENVVDYFCNGTGTDVSLTSAGGTSLVNDGTGPALAIKGLTGGTGITVTDNVIGLTITNSDPGSAVTLGFTGSGQSIVNDGVGPALVTKTITAGTGISVTSNATDVFVTNTDAGSSQNIFKNIAVSGQSTVVADNNNDTLTLVAGSGISITTNATTDSVTITNTNNTNTNNLFVNITGNSDILEAVASGGVPPYTYVWSSADLLYSIGQPMFILIPDPTDPSNPAKRQAQVNPNPLPRFDSCGINGGGSISLAKVIVTDANGNKALDTFLLMNLVCAVPP